MKLEEFVKTCSSSLDKLHGQAKAISYEFDGGTRYGFTEDEYEDKPRQEVESAVGEKIYAIDKGFSAIYDFFEEIEKTNPGEIRKVSNDIDEIKFEDFSIYKYKYTFYGRTYKYFYMNCREVILPPKTKIKKGPKRIYVVSLDKKFYSLPELEYPKMVGKLLVWLKKKKKITFKEKPMIWSGTKKIKMENWYGNTVINEIEFRYHGSYMGYPIRNIKSKFDLDEYNLWLSNDFKDLVNDHNKGCTILAKTNSYWKTKLMTVPAPLCPTELAISQSDVDQFVKEQNTRYQVKR